MEKSTPHCNLSLVRSLIEADKVRATASAFIGARELGLCSLSEMCAVVLSLSRSDFYKSMTTHADHRIWQDVYKTCIANDVDVYLKLENTSENIKDKVVEIKLNVMKKSLFVKEVSKTFEGALEMALTSMVEQVKKTKSRKRA